MNQYYQCLVQQSAVYPPQGRGVCNIFIHEWQSCGYDFAKDSNVYQEQARSYWYMRSKEIQQGWEFKLKVALIGGVLDTLGLVAQKLAYETAQLILTGGDSQEPMFWNQPFGTWLENTANQASSEFLFNIDKFVQQQAVGTPFQGISLCRKPNPLMIKMNLGMGRLALLNPRGQCTLSQLADNFEAIADMVESGDALAIQRPQFYEGGPANDLSAGLSINNAYLNYTTNKVLSAELQRTEGQGMKQITDKITGALQYPSVLANNSLMQLDPVKMALTEQDKQESYMVEAFWQAGLEGIGFIALKVFINTMALGILHKIFDPKKPSGASVNATPEQMSIQYEVLKNADAAGDSQDLFERQEFAKALGDFRGAQLQYDRGSGFGHRTLDLHGAANALELRHGSGSSHRFGRGHARRRVDRGQSLGRGQRKLQKHGPGYGFASGLGIDTRKRHQKQHRSLMFPTGLLRRQPQKASVGPHRARGLGNGRQFALQPQKRRQIRFFGHGHPRFLRMQRQGRIGQGPSVVPFDRSQLDNSRTTLPMPRARLRQYR